MTNSPQNIYIPKLYSENSFTIYWSQVEGASEYELDLSINEPFETALRSLEWMQIAEIGKSWSDIEASEKQWNEIAMIPARGKRWEQIDLSDQSWDQIDTSDYSWKNISNIPLKLTVYKGSGIPISDPFLGLSWYDIEKRGKTWLEIRTADLKWHEFEELFATGYIWDQLDAKFLDWDTAETLADSWDEFEELDAGPLEYTSCIITVPDYARKIFFRLRALDEFGTESDYLYSTAIPVIFTDSVTLDDAEYASQRVLVGGITKLPTSKKISISYDSDNTNVEALKGQSRVLSTRNGNIEMRYENSMYGFREGLIAETIGQRDSTLLESEITLAVSDRIA